MARILRELKEGELTLKDMGVLRETLSARAQAKRTSGELKEYGLNHTVHLSWKHDPQRYILPFTLHIDAKRYLLSWTELMEMDRAGFFRREIEPKVTLKWGDGSKITIRTDLNDEAERDYIVLFITQDGDELYLDWQEFLKTGRFI